MKEGWEYKKIKDVGSVIAGTTPNTNVAEYWNGNLCWISPAELNGSHYLYDSRKKITEAAVKAKSLRLLPEGTVILSSRAPIGKVVINKIPTYCNQGFKCVVCGEEIYNEFLYWWFWGKTEYLNSLGTGATFKEISKKVVEDILIPVPPRSEQQRIVDYLDATFAKIDAMKANAGKALNEAKALFQASLKEMLEPKEGWENKSLGEVCDKITDGSHNPPKGVEKSDNLMLSSQNIQNDYLDMKRVRFISDEDFKTENQRTQAKKGDVLLTIVGTIGRTCVLKGTEGNITFQRSVAVLKPTKELISRFLMFFLISQNSELNAAAQGAAQKGIYLKQLGNIGICFPPLSEQQSIVETLDTLKSKVDRLQANFDKVTQECDALKQAILRQVFE